MPDRMKLTPKRRELLERGREMTSAGGFYTADRAEYLRCEKLREGGLLRYWGGYKSRFWQSQFFDITESGRALLQLVCSNKPRPSVHRSGKGHQHWRRDVHHVQAPPSVAGRDMRTFCSRDASEWLLIGPITADSASDHNLCKKCLSKLMDYRS